jgi:hypothetical protein
VDTLLIEFDGMRKRNFVPRKKLRVAVARGAGVGQILLRYSGRCFARSLNLMHRPVAGHASRSVRIALGRRLTVNTQPEFLHFIGVALRAFCGRRQRSGSYFVLIPVAGLAGNIERAVDAALSMSRLVSVTGQALNLGYFGGMRELFNGGMTVGTA